MLAQPSTPSKLPGSCSGFFVSYGAAFDREFPAPTAFSMAAAKVQLSQGQLAEHMLLVSN